RISGKSTPTETVFSIQDNGRGIPEADLPKVFEPFGRAGTPDVPGEGMGLAYVQTLVRRHGGRIWCNSRVGVGTTFSFSIAHNPLKEIQPAEAEKVEG
ncbi:MAG: ATP-binding protein, partial [Calditrichaeota bacterium]|nr:ATP-binding protein [Calditrichota bacterium]